MEAAKDSGGKRPGAPTIGTPTLVSGTVANVNFTAPAYIGKGTVSYRATASSGQTATGSSSPVQVTGLTPGSTVTFTVVAISSNGVESVPSGTSASLVMGIAPSAPTIGTATAGNAQATVTFTQGATGTAAAADVTYRATSSPGGIQATGVNVTSLTVTGLANGTAYTFTVRAESVFGNSPESASSNSVTPVAPPYFPPFFPPFFPPYFPPFFPPFFPPYFPPFFPPFFPPYFPPFFPPFFPPYFPPRFPPFFPPYFPPRFK